VGKAAARRARKKLVAANAATERRIGRHGRLARRPEPQAANDGEFAHTDRLVRTARFVLAEAVSRALSVPILSIDSIEAAMWRAGLIKTETGVAAYEVAHALADENLRLRHTVIVDAVNPVEAPRAAWRKLAAKHRVSLKIIECVCSDETIHRGRIEAPVAGKRELTWARLLQRRAEYEAWTDPRLVLDTSRTSPAQLLAQALNYTR
jgi:predicted kinase